LALDGNIKVNLYSFYNEKVLNKTITDDLYNHLIKSLRFNVGDCFFFFDKQCEYYCSLSAIGKNFASFEIKETHPIVESNKPFITLIQGYPKSDKTDFICKYATIYNVKEIIFVYMKRSIPNPAKVEAKLTRWQAIILEAVSLSKRRSVPKVRIVNNLASLDLEAFDNLYLLDEEAKSPLTITKQNNVAIIVGPEGGIDDSERLLLKYKCQRVSLGTNILPTEVASLAVLALFLG
jgi:16S rRNA (uracil1498-N3)-methyltransferase